MRSSVIIVPLLPPPAGQSARACLTVCPAGLGNQTRLVAPGHGSWAAPATRRRRIRRSERVDLRLEAVRVDLHLLLDDVLPALDRCLDPSFHIGGGDHDEPAGAGIE